MPRLVLVIAAALALAAPARARADAKSEARARMERATQLHAEGKYSEALVELTTAYSLDPRAEILYAIAQTYVQLGNCAQAIMFYERYLSTGPGATPAAAAEEAIDACKSGAITRAEEPNQLEAPPEGPEQSGSTLPPLPPPPDPPSPPLPSPTPVDSAQPWYRDALGEALVGGGVVCGLITAVAYRSALGDLDRADAAADYLHHADFVDSAHHKRTISALFAIGGAGLIGAGVARLVLHSRHADDAGVAIAPLPGGAVLGWSTTF